MEDLCQDPLLIPKPVDNKTMGSDPQGLGTQAEPHCVRIFMSKGGVLG